MNLDYKFTGKLRNKQMCKLSKRVTHTKFKHLDE